MIYKLINNLVPLYLSELCLKYVKSRKNYDLRANDHLQSLPETMGQIVKCLNTANVQFPPCPLFNVSVIKK